MSVSGAQSIFKSYVPGQGWKAATAMTRSEKSLRHYWHETKLPIHKPMGKGAPSSKGRTVWGGVKNPPGKKIAIGDDPSFHNTQVLGLSHPNGKGGGTIRMNPALKEKQHRELMAHTFRHERAHLTPKRNPVRMMERINSSDRTRGREEGRADFIANQGKPPPKSYPGNADFQGGYQEVQRKMTNAKKRRVSKEYSWESLRREVAKMSPDPSSVHVMSAMTGRRRGRLKKVSKR